MKLREFKYSGKDRRVLVMKENNNQHKNFTMGIDLSHLTEDEAKQLKAIHDKYMEDIQPFMKAWRNFTTEKLESEPQEVEF